MNSSSDSFKHMFIIQVFSHQRKVVSRLPLKTNTYFPGLQEIITFKCIPFFIFNWCCEEIWGEKDPHYEQGKEDRNNTHEQIFLS